ncbi:MAG TPA: response regulator transcription factor [Gaiellaceae bacterium]|nr:response regulator transcription factor [Gaiellaceae bacterium]
MPIRVVLVEDNQVFRETLELLLSLRDDVEVVASVDNGAEAAAVVGSVQPDVVLMDYRLPGLNGAEATRAIRRASPHVAVVCLTASVSAREVEELYEAGAQACVTKDEALDRIVSAIHGAIA